MNGAESPTGTSSLGMPKQATNLLVRKYVNESLLLFLACGFMLFVFCWARVWILCQFDLQKFEPLLEQFKAFEKFSPVPLEQFLTYAGSIAIAFSEPVLILCVVVWSISRGSDVVSGELGRGTLEMLLAQPITRLRLVLTHSIVCTMGLALLCTLAWLGISAGIHTNTVPETIRPELKVPVPFSPLSIPVPLGEAETVQTPLSEKVSASLYIPPTINLFGFGFFIFGLSTMLSCFDRYRWRTIGMVIGVYVIQILTFLFSRATEWSRVAENFSFFSLYQPDAIVQLTRNEPQAAWSILSPVQITGYEFWLGPLGMSLTLIVFGCFFIATGIYRFCNRDLPAPL